MAKAHPNKLADWPTGRPADRPTGRLADIPMMDASHNLPGETPDSARRAYAALAALLALVLAAAHYQPALAYPLAGMWTAASLFLLFALAAVVSLQSKLDLRGLTAPALALAIFAAWGWSRTAFSAVPAEGSPFVGNLLLGLAVFYLGAFVVRGSCLFADKAVPSSDSSALNPQSSALSTQHSALSTQPSALSPQPSALTPQFSALSTQPSALSPQHSALSPQPSALTPQSSALSPQSSALSPQPSALRSHSSVHSPQPSALSTLLCSGPMAARVFFLRSGRRRRLPRYPPVPLPVSPAV